MLVGYPLAYALWRLTRPGLQRWLGVIIFSPILVSVVVRSYGWTVLLADQGPVNWFLQTLLGFPDPVRLVFQPHRCRHQPHPRLPAIRGVSDLLHHDAASIPRCARRLWT